MAISKILHMKDCGSSFHGKHLKSALDYITVLEKTQNGRLVAAVNCQVDMAFEQMKETKMQKLVQQSIINWLKLLKKQMLEMRKHRQMHKHSLYRQVRQVKGIH